VADSAQAKASPDQKVTKERLEAWLKEGADLNQELSNAVLAGDVARISFLIEKGADVNKRDAQGYTALQSAARNRRAELISVLLAYKADANLRDVDGYTALHHAVLRNHPESVRALAQRGADLSATTPTGYTPLALAIIEDQYKAAMALIEAGAPVDTAVGDTQLTPLMLTAGKEARRLSLAAGISRVEKLNPQDPGQLEVAKALLDRGAKVNAVSASGVTALLLAAAHNNAPIVGLLAESGADKSAKTHDGFTAEDLARQNGNSAVVSLLTLLGQAGSN
jgi:ankyrin repeat protein